MATVEDLTRPLGDRFAGCSAGIAKGCAAIVPPRVVETLPLVKSLRIIVLLPLGFLSRASIVICLASFLTKKRMRVDQY
jgi:hypothetical protein